ncbi:MAG: hypothetical protein Q7I93_05140 [Syntrophales bacterium]|nr:hypothetical protein [Syntrophales bacterium]
MNPHNLIAAMYQHTLLRQGMLLKERQQMQIYRSFERALRLPW